MHLHSIKSLKRLFFVFLFLLNFLGVLAQDSSIYFNDLLYIDTILNKYKVSAIDELPVKGLKEVSDEYFRINYSKENIELIKTILAHPDFKTLDNHKLEQIHLQSKIYMFEGKMDSAKILYDSLIAIDDGGYYAGLSAWGSLFLNQIQKDSIELHRYFKIAEQGFFNEKYYFELGAIHYQMGRLYANSNPKYAIELFTVGIEHFNNADKTDIKVIDYLASIYTYRGVIENSLGNIVNAYKDFTHGNIWANLSKRATKIAWVSNSLGLYYAALGIYDSSKVYFERALYFNERLGDKFWIAINKINFGSSLFYSGEKEKGIDQLKEGITFINERKFNYEGSGKSQLAIFYLQMDSVVQAEALANEIIRKYKSTYGDDTPLLALPYAIQSWVFVKNKRYGEAKKIAEKAIGIVDKQAIPTIQKKVYQIVYKAYYEMGEYKLAFDFLNKSKQISDTLTGSKTYLQLLSMEKETSNKMLEMEKEKAILEQEKNIAQLEEEKMRKYISYGGVFVLLIMLVFIFNRLRITNKQNKIIEAKKNEIEYQKNLVDEKNTEITSSIQYAKRLQQAILPPLSVLETYFNDAFILYKPKDIVAGDFYWIEKIEDTIYFAVADCTGHGVPGAMVSVICSNALDRSVKELGISDPAEILNQTREFVIKRFNKSESEIKDGMDIALCSLKLSESSAILKYAGANNPLYHIKQIDENITEKHTHDNHCYINEIRPDKQPIGRYANDISYTTHTVELKKGESIYIFTDGFADQFGGEKGKKLMYKPFKKMLLKYQNMRMNEQKESINNEFINWMGSHEQIDDVCIMGVRY